MKRLRLCRGLMLLSMLTVLAGCVSHAEGVMEPVAIPENSQTRVVDMLVATSRLPSHDPATLFSGERSPRPYITDVAVSIPPAKARKVGSVVWPKRLPPDPKTDFAVVRARNLNSVKEGRDWLARHSKGGHVMVFVHGFNNTYEDSVFRFAQIVHDSGANITPILFTWPSRANVFDYNYDKESTNYSRAALERALKLLADDRNVTDITILAHSMGTWLAMESLRQMAIREGAIPRKIDNVILASPDIDVDVFARQWTELGTRKPNFTIFVSQDDRALALSRFISGDVQRLGAINPADEPYKSQFEKAGVTVLDLTKVQTEDGLRHGKFAESPQIVQLIGKRLATGQTLTDSDVSLGEGLGAVVAGTASSIGNVAAKTVTAPEMILTKRKRVEPVDQTLDDAPKPLE